MAGQPSLDALDALVVEETGSGPNQDRWMSNVVDIINASFITITQAFQNLVAIGQATTGGSGPGPYTISATGVTASNFVNVTLVTSTNSGVTVSSVTAGSGSFTVTFSADPGASSIIAWQAYASQPQ